MFQVADIWSEAKKVAGFCDQDKLFAWISDAIALIGNKGTFDPYTGFLDLCVSEGRSVTLPREVEAVLAVNVGGHPTLGRDQLFSFHLNGPGDCQKILTWTWDDKGFACTYKDLTAPSRLVAMLQRQEDAGKEILVYGFDQNKFPVRQERGGVLQDGWQVPTIYGYPVFDASAPVFSRITRIRKAESAGVIKLATIDQQGTTGDVLGVFEPDETDPSYRRILLGRSAAWVRIAYRKVNPRIRSLYERIPLRSRMGFLLAMRAIKAYDDNNLVDAHAYEADAARLEIEAQQSAESFTMAPLQVVDIGNNLNDRRYSIE